MKFVQLYVQHLYHSLREYKLYSEFELLNAIREDDRIAFNEIFDRFWNKAHRIAFSKTNSNEVSEEIIQDVFLTIWIRRKTLLINNFSSYLYICVRNRSLNYIEGQLAQEKKWNFYKQFIPLSERTTDESVEYDSLVEALEDGMKDLPLKSKRVFQLSRIEGRSVSEIAVILNLSEKAIEYHITQSLKRLRVHLKDFTTLLILLSYI